MPQNCDHCHVSAEASYTYIHKLTFLDFFMNLSLTQNYEIFARILYKIMLFMGQRLITANCKKYRTHHFEVV